MAYAQCHRTCEESCLQRNQQPHGSYGLNGHPYHLQGTNNSHHSSTGQYYNNHTGMLSQPGYVVPNNNHGYSQAGTGYAHGLGLGGGYAHGNGHGHGHGHGGYAHGQVNAAAGTNYQGRTNYKRREHRTNMVHRMKDGISSDSSYSSSDSESDNEKNCHRRKSFY